MFELYNPNPRNRRVGDCAVRALAKATGQSWDDAYDEMTAQGKYNCNMPSSDEVWGAAGNMTAGDLEYIDKLTHTLKSLKTTIAMEEAEENGGWSYDDGMMNDGRSMRDGGRMYRYNGRYSRADNRGRGSRASRDRMGRYTSRGYSRAEGVKEMLKNAMNMAENDRERDAIRKALDEMEH